MVYVSWKDAMQFCEELTEHERTCGRLPQAGATHCQQRRSGNTHAAAGTTTRFSFGDNEAEIGEYAWYGRTDNGNAQNEIVPAPSWLKEAKPVGVL